MPLLIPTDELQPGMALAEALIADGRVMLRGGRPLSADDIGAMRRRYPGQRLRVLDPVLDEVVKFEDDRRERQIAAETQRHVARAVGRVHERLHARTAIDAGEIGLLAATVHELLDDLKSDKPTAALVDRCLDPQSYLSLHTGNVFYLSVLLALKCRDYVIAERQRQTRLRNLRPNFAEDLVPLGLGAMLIDVALTRRVELLRADRPLTDDERAELFQHPRAGAKLLPDKMSALARMVVRTHHENLCGTGYPRGTPGDKQHVFTRVVRIADAFDAATSRGLYRAARTPARVLWELSAGPYRACYDAKLVQTLVGLIQPFPIGSRLRLSDGRFATVVQYNRQDVFDPAVVIAFDAQNQPLPRDRLEGPLHLRRRADLRLAAYEDEDLGFLYADPPPALQPDVAAFRTAWAAAYP